MEHAGSVAPNTVNVELEVVEATRQNDNHGEVVEGKKSKGGWKTAYILLGTLLTNFFENSVSDSRMD